MCRAGKDLTCDKQRELLVGYMVSLDCSKLVIAGSILLGIPSSSLPHPYFHHTNSASTGDWRAKACAAAVPSRGGRPRRGALREGDPPPAGPPGHGPRQDRRLHTPSSGRQWRGGARTRPWALFRGAGTATTVVLWCHVLRALSACMKFHRHSTRRLHYSTGATETPALLPLCMPTPT